MKLLIKFSTFSLLSSTLLLAACGDSGVTTAKLDKPDHLLEYQQKTLEQAKDLEATLKAASDKRMKQLN